MHCIHCGTENDKEARFCANCGKPMPKEEPGADGRNGMSGGPGGAGGMAGAGGGTGGMQDRSMYKYEYNSGNSDATVALIFGILSIVACFSGFVSIGMGIAALVLANKAQKSGSQSGNISAAKICGIIGICLGIIGFLYYCAAFFYSFLKVLS